MNESETRAELIDPQLQERKWQVKEKNYKEVLKLGMVKTEKILLK